MSFGTAALRFATQAARERATLFAGETAAGGYNLQIGETRFCAAFVQLATGYELMMHGRRVVCTARFLLPPTVDLTLDVATTVTHLPTGDVYEVIEHRPNPVTGERSVHLRRQEP